MMKWHQYLHEDGTPCTTRENLKAISNLNNPSVWLFRRQRIKAGELAESGSEEECEKYLKELQDSSERELGYWRFTQ